MFGNFLWPFARFATLVLMLGCWLELWISFGMTLREWVNNVAGDQPTPAAATLQLVGFLAGLIGTNVTGYRHYRNEQKPCAATLAAIDLEVPYFIFKEGREHIRGNADKTSGLREVRRRTALWRGLPGATISFIVAFHSRFRMAFCQYEVSQLVSRDSDFRDDVIAALARKGLDAGNETEPTLFPTNHSVRIDSLVEVLAAAFDRGCDVSHISISEGNSDDYMPVSGIYQGESATVPLVPSATGAMMHELLLHIVEPALATLKRKIIGLEWFMQTTPEEVMEIFARQLPKILWERPSRREFFVYRTEHWILLASLQLLNAFWGLTEITLGLQIEHGAAAKAVTFLHIFLDGTLHVVALIIALLLLPCARSYETLVLNIENNMSLMVDTLIPTLRSIELVPLTIAIKFVWYGEMIDVSEEERERLEVFKDAFISVARSELQELIETHGDEVLDALGEVLHLDLIFLLRFMLLACACGCLLVGAAWLAGSRKRLLSVSQLLMCSPMLALKPAQQDQMITLKIKHAAVRLGFQVVVLLLPNVYWDASRAFAATALNFAPSRMSYHSWLFSHVTLLMVSTYHLASPQLKEKQQKSEAKLREKAIARMMAAPAAPTHPFPPIQVGSPASSTE